MTKGKGADVLLTKNGDYYFFDIKTVQVNANGGNSFNETLILWTAYYKYKYGVDANKINAMLAFPYNSADENNDAGWWRDFGGRISPLTRQNVFVGNEYWSFLTGNPNALQSIIDGVNELSGTTEFVNLYKKIYDCENQNELVYFSELVKLNEINKKFSVEIITHNSPLNMRGKVDWEHGTCQFSERVNILLKTEQYICPECNQELSSL